MKEQIKKEQKEQKYKPAKNSRRLISSSAARNGNKFGRFFW
jgi:hypothetical protein